MNSVVLRTTLLAVLSLCGIPFTARALPAGRAWIPIDTLNVPGHSKIVPDFMQVDSRGIPFVVAATRGGVGADTYGLLWADSAWSVAWQLGYGIGPIWRVDATPGRYPLLWSGLEEQPDGRVVFSFNEASRDSVTAAEPIAVVATGNWRYSGAARGRRRWALIDDLILNEYRGLRLFYSDAPRVWTEKRLNLIGNTGVAAAAADDTTLLVAWGNYPEFGIRWGRFVGKSWIPADSFLSTHPLAAAPRLRPRSGGGFWLAWTHQEGDIYLSSNGTGAWASAETLRCAYKNPNPHQSHQPDMSRDSGPYPVIAWSNRNLATGAQTICVCVPSDSGFGVAEELEGPQNSIVPTVARDLNEDAWVAWSLDRVNEGMVWTHTYTTVMSEIPRASVASRGRLLEWRLTGAASGSWWAVMRARGSGPFQEVARVRAGPGLELSWNDTMPPEGPLRYKIRRESVDRRYEWLSDEAVWSAPDQSALRLASIPAPFQDGMSVELVGARAGDFELTLYDLHGRVVFERRSPASGTGHDTIRLDFAIPPASLSPGVYFLRVRDSAGQTSNTGRLVLIR